MCRTHIYKSIDQSHVQEGGRLLIIGKVDKKKSGFAF